MESRIVASDDQFLLRYINLDMAITQPIPGIFLSWSFRIILALWFGPAWNKPCQRKFQSVLDK